MASETVRNPVWARFDADWYLARHGGELADGSPGDAAAAERHYETEGRQKGFSPNRFFDEAWYLAINPDVAEAVRHGNFASGFAHYLKDGFRNRAPHWLFSETHYLSRYPDLTRATLARLGLANGYDHYLTYGDREFRSGHLFFDPRLFYANALLAPFPVGEADSHPATAIPETGPFASFLAQPDAGNRLRVSWYFDPHWYLDSYPQVAAAVETGQVTSALHHFLTTTEPGAFRALEWFEESYYRALYPDIASAIEGGQFRSAYDHFVRYGALERRRPHPDLDLEAYFLSGTVRVDIENGLVRDAFVHWLSRRHTQVPDAGVERPDPEMFEGIAARKAETLVPVFVRHPLEFTPTDTPQLSVILYARNRFPLTLSTLSAVRTTFHGPVQVIVIDAGSQDDTRRLENYVHGLKILRLDATASHVAALDAARPHILADTILWLGQGIRPGHDALQAGLRQLGPLDTPTPNPKKIGLVTGKILRADGRILEAGGIVWRDGSVGHYMEGAAITAPEASFTRAVACGTQPFLLLRRALVEELGGFDPAFDSQQGLLVDISLRAAERGYTTLYEPAMVATLDLRDPAAAPFGPLEEKTLRRHHAVRLQQADPPSPTLVTHARSLPRPLPRSRRKRILFVEDQVPLRRLGSGFVRSNDIVRAMVALGHEVTVAPIYRATEPLPALYADFPPEVEILHDRGFEEFDRLPQERNGCYDALWIGRTHNLGRLMPHLLAHAASLPRAVILDTEALTAPRNAQRARILGLPDPGSLAEAVERELGDAWFCRTLVAVNTLDAQAIREAGYRNVMELGHACPVRPTPAGWAEREGLLFVGAIHESGAPNHDSLVWFVEEVLPLLRDLLPPEARLSVAGFRGLNVDLSALGRSPRVELLGPVADTAELYARHRVFIAPTRFAGGIPFKIHEAASYGLPVVASELLCRQLGWRDGVEIASGGDNDAIHFAIRLAELYTQEDMWLDIRQGALDALERDNSLRAYTARLNAILQRTFEED